MKAKIYSIDGLSAHADQDEWMEWMEWAEGFSEKPKVAFVIHGEEEAARVLTGKLYDELGWNTVVPHHLESVVLFKGI